MSLCRLSSDKAPADVRPGKLALRKCKQTVVNKLHETRWRTDADAALLVLEELNLLSDLHVLREQLRYCVVLGLELSHSPANVSKWDSTKGSMWWDLPDEICSSQPGACHNESVRCSLLLRRLAQGLRLVGELLHEGRQVRRRAVFLPRTRVPDAASRQRYV